MTRSTIHSTSSLATLFVLLCVVGTIGDDSPPADKREEPTEFSGATAQQRLAFDLVSQEARLESSEPRSKRIELLRRAIQADPGDTIINRMANRMDGLYGTYRHLADLLRADSQFAEALTVYGQVLTRLPGAEPRLWADIARVWEESGDKVRALEFYWHAAKEGYQGVCDDGRGLHDGRHFLFRAYWELTPDRASKAEWIQKEIDQFDDWIAYYHRAQFYKPREDEDWTHSIPHAQQVIATLQAAIEALDRSERQHGDHDVELRKRLMQERADAQSELEGELWTLRQKLERK